MLHNNTLGMVTLLAPTNNSTFKRQGFIVLENVLTPSAVHALRREVDTVFEEMCASQAARGSGDNGPTQALPPNPSASSTPTRSLLHPEWIMSLHQVLPGGNQNWMWRLATDPKLLDMLEHHLGPDIVLFSTQLAIKPAGSGWDVPW